MSMRRRLTFPDSEDESDPGDRQLRPVLADEEDGGERDGEQESEEEVEVRGTVRTSLNFRLQLQADVLKLLIAAYLLASVLWLICR